MYFLRKTDLEILETLDTETLALITTIKDRLGIPTFIETIGIVKTCTEKYNLEHLLLKLMLKTEEKDE